MNIKKYNENSRISNSLLSLIIGGSFSLSVIVGTSGIGLNTHQFKVLDSVSQVYNSARERTRINQMRKLVAERKIVSPNSLPNKPFGGMNMFGTLVQPQPQYTIAQAANLVDEIYPPISSITGE